MPKQKIVVLMGSSSDMPFAHRIQDFLNENHIPIKCEYRVVSAHRNVEKLLTDLKSYEQSKANIVYITIAGLSDALSGVVAGYSKYPVIACPPDIEKHGLSKVFSTLLTPKGVAVSLVSAPENAALAAVKILALSDSSLQNRVNTYIDKMRSTVSTADNALRRKKADELEREHVEHEEET